jgi:serine/threonine protein phosphatase PrpC
VNTEPEKARTAAVEPVPPPAEVRPATLVCRALTDVGLRRRSNEDSVLARPEIGLFVVADGMGGHAAGEVASRITIEVAEESVRLTADPDATWPAGYEDGLPRGCNRLRTALRLANQRVIDASRENRQYRGMASTAVAALVGNGTAHVAHAGDSRIYLWRAGALSRLTVDHSYVSERILDGSLTPEEARVHPLRNMVTRAVGGRPELDVEVKAVPVLSGDALLLCSDGLTGMLPDGDIAGLLAAAGATPEEAVTALVAEANARGGDDNITVLVARIP